jgi:uncharacterized protein YgiM (DUF1202 family)
MQTSPKKYLRISTHSLFTVGLVSGLLVLAACQPVRPESVVAAEQTAAAAGATPAAGTPTATALAGVEAPTATVSTKSLRVRTTPSDDGEQIASVKQGESFPVVGISSDGEWIQISIEGGPDGKGWVSAEFVTLEGDITNIQVVGTPEATVEATAEVTAEVTAEATEEPTEEATAEATEEPTQEATVEATAVMTEEATAEPTEEMTVTATEEATEEATAAPTEEATEEATPEPTAEPTEEATITPTEEATVTTTVEATAEPTVEATTEPTATATSEAGGITETVTITSELPLRVRSAPNTDTDNKIGNVFNGETYTVLEVSADGVWVRIETPQFPEGSGWISSEYVVFNKP